MNRRNQPTAFTLSAYPSPLTLARALWRPNAPFVMVNLLSFRAKATGPRFEGWSGREAYLRYAESVRRVQGPLGSKLLLSGDVEPPPTAPPFDLVGLLQYASPWSFVRFVMGGGADGEARLAGLAGQWLLACTTLQDRTASAVADGALLVETVGDASPEWHGARARALGEAQGELLWQGRVDRQVIGTSTPGLRHVEVTAFASKEARDRGFDRIRDATPRAAVWWGLPATANALLADFR